MSASCRMLIGLVVVFAGMSLPASAATLEQDSSSITCKNNCENDTHSDACEKTALRQCNRLIEITINKIGKSDPTTKSAIRASQSNWLKSLSALCSLFDKRDPGASITPTNCRYRETVTRALILGELKEAVEEH